MNLSDIVTVLEGRLDGADVRFDAVSSDTRNIARGDLFVALRGERFDGSTFVADAAKAGAVAALVNADSPVADAPIPVLYVADTRLALGKLAAYWRNRFDIPLIAVTGSNGKTTVKEMLASILAQAASSAEAVLATRGNLNNDIGMPQTLLRLNAQHRYAVIEMGMNHPGEIDYLTRIARPDVALVNNASGAHLAGLGSVEAVARAKGEIFAGLGEQGIAVINADDRYADLWRELAAPHRIMDFSLDGDSTVSSCWDVTETGIQIEIIAPDGEVNVQLQVPGAHNARNALAAATAALAVGVPLAQIGAGLEAFSGVKGRLQRKAGRNGAHLIDDTYNANPASMRAALQVLAQQKGKRVFVMGDMGELGADAAAMHAEVGATARQLGIQKLYALGELSRAAVEAFGAEGRHFDELADLQAALETELDGTTSVLVKGSRFMKMERVVACCMEQGEACCSH
jgi:UDP-N-acetylmuramoyl-tripeptide--D-alanyl-D-alanine ligase